MAKYPNVAATVLETETHYVLQQRDDIPTIVQPGKVSAFGGSMEPSDKSSLDAAYRELTEETSLRPDKSALRLLQTLDVQGVNSRGEATSCTYFIYGLTIDNVDFEVYEGQGAYSIEKGADMDKHNLVPSMKMFFNLYIED